MNNDTEVNELYEILSIESDFELLCDSEDNLTDQLETRVYLEDIRYRVSHGEAIPLENLGY